MSYDLAVWDGERPSSDAAAADMLEQLMQAGEANEFSEPPSARIQAYVGALLERWPDLMDDDEDQSPWASGPLIGNAFGNVIYFDLVWSKALEGSEFAVDLADRMGLVCYDPQAGSLRPPTEVQETAKRGWLGRLRKG